MSMLDGKVAIITGAARGTGEETARKFVAEGARVVLADVLDDLGEAVAASLGDAAVYTHLDVTAEEDWSAAVKCAGDAFGSVTVLVNNAGVLVIRPIDETTVEDFERLVSVNLLGTFLGIKAVIEPMTAAGGGSIVNVSSIDGLRGGNRRSAYCASKWGVRGLTKAAAFDLGQFGIRVNAVCPGGGSAEMASPWIGPNFDHPAHLQTVALGRDGELSDYAAAIAFLASDAAAYVTAIDLPVDGGVTAGQNLRGFIND
jgi:3alpha(or 20beta)-hydroxysteroid dehydrogenase